MSDAAKGLVWIPASPDGCGFYRLWLPHLYTPGSHFILVDPRNPPSVATLARFHTVVVQRQMSKENYASLKIMRDHKTKIVYDLDDDLWNIPPWNPMRKIFQQTQITKGMAPCLKMCNQVVVSTPRLKQLVEEKTDGGVPVTVIENGIDLNLFVRLRRRVARDYVVVGWAGSNTHDGDVTEAMEALSRLMLRRPDIRCCIMSSSVPYPLAKAELVDRVRLTPFVPVWQFPAWWSNVDWDIALAPLMQHSFNDSKSCVKLLEAGALEIPCICSPVAAYRKFCEGDEILEQLLCDGTRAAWARHIERLVDDADFRLEAGRRARKRVEAEYNILERAARWRTLFEKLWV